MVVFHVLYLFWFPAVARTQHRKTGNRNFIVEQKSKIKAPCSTALPLTLPQELGESEICPSRSHCPIHWLTETGAGSADGYWALLPRCPTSHASTQAAQPVWETVHLARIILLFNSVLESNQTFKATAALLTQPEKRAQVRTLQEKADSCCLATQLKTSGCLRLGYRHYPDKCKTAEQKTSTSVFVLIQWRNKSSKSIDWNSYLIINYRTSIKLKYMKLFLLRLKII